MHASAPARGKVGVKAHTIYGARFQRLQYPLGQNGWRFSAYLGRKVEGNYFAPVSIDITLPICKHTDNH